MKNTFLPIQPMAETKKWYLIDAKKKTLGRVSTQIAQILIGKHKVEYTPHIDVSDYVIVINAQEINLSGKKSKTKLYRSHSGRPGGMKVKTFSEVQKYQPTRIIEKSVKGMLPKNILANTLSKKLKVYSGSEHPHSAQQPILVF